MYEAPTLQYMFTMDYFSDFRMAAFQSIDRKANCSAELVKNFYFVSGLSIPVSTAKLLHSQFIFFFTFSLACCMLRSDGHVFHTTVDDMDCLRNMIVPLGWNLRKNDDMTQNRIMYDRRENRFLEVIWYISEFEARSTKGIIIYSELLLY